MAAAALVVPYSTLKRENGRFGDPTGVITKTPSDYHRIVSPTLHIPSDTSLSIPVGLLACQRDPLLRTLETTIISASLLTPSPPPSVKKGGHTKQVKASSVPTFQHPVLQVVLHDTVLFPEGGGQPTDIGTLTSEDGVSWDIELVKRHGGVAVHYVKLAEGVSNVPDAFAPEKQVRLALGHAGFQRRLDHMSMHTSQHLLSSVIDTSLKLPTVTWSLTPWPAPAYIDLPRPLTAAEVSQVQDEVNRYVFEARRVYVEVDDLHSGQTGVDSGDGGATSRELGRGLPRDYTGGVHRMVIIEGVDRTPCCGTHLPDLSSLQLFLLPPPTTSSTTSSSSAGPSRHYFLAGPRLLNYLGSVQSLLTRSAGVLSCGPPELPERVALVVDESKRREKRVDDLERELAGVLGRQLAEEMVQWRDAGGEGEWVRCVSRTDDSPSAQTFLMAVTVAFAAARPAEQADAPHRYTFLLVSSPSSRTSSSTSIVMLFGNEEKRVKVVGDELKKQFKTLRGGGKGTRWSGKFVGVWLADREEKQALAVLSQSL
ncbi:ThrRS/AlaRS common domain-containing protein [Lactifluus volemus]|nr:ThrRS/AlaRS common domain-containing protein [Lactifluus volemus]